MVVSLILGLVVVAALTHVSRSVSVVALSRIDGQMVATFYVGRQGVPTINQQTANRFSESPQVDAPCIIYIVLRARASALARVWGGSQYKYF